MATILRPGVTYLTRGDWGARTDLPRLGYPVAKGRRIRSIFHHTVIIDDDATANLWETLTEVIAKMRQLQTIRPDLGLDVPYSFVIFLMADGTIMVCEGRGVALTGAHTHGHNTDGIGVALEGNFMLPVNVTPYVPLISGFLGWLKYDQGLESLGPINGHSDFSSTACPGDNLYPVLGQLAYTREEDDMATPQEIAEAVWAHPLANHIDGAEQPARLLLGYAHLEAFNGSFERTRFNEVDKADMNLGDLIRWTHLEAHNAANREFGGLSTEALQEIAEAVANEQARRMQG